MAFYGARLDETEANAKGLLAEAQRVQKQLEENSRLLLGHMVPGWHDWPDVEAMAARVLRDIAAKRAIVARWVKSREDPRDIRLVAHAELEGNLALLWAVRQDAAIYSDHPDYRPEWKPEA